MIYYIKNKLSRKGIIPERSFIWNGVEFELRRIAVTPEQIQDYDLIEDPEYDPEKTFSSKQRLPQMSG